MCLTRALVALSSGHASSRIGGVAGRHVRRRRREGTDGGGPAGIGRGGRCGLRGHAQGGGRGRIFVGGVPDRTDGMAVLFAPDRDPRGGTAHGVRARHEPLLSHGGTEARRTSHGGGRQGCRDGRPGVHRTPRGGGRRDADRRGDGDPRGLRRGQAGVAGRRLRAASQCHGLRQRGYRARQRAALGVRDRGGRLRLRDGKRALAQVSAGGPGGDRRTSWRSGRIRAWTARRWA